MDYSEDSERVQEVEHVQDDDHGVHLVLLQVGVGIEDHVNVLLFVATAVVVFEDRVDVLVVGHLRVVELQQEEDDDHGVSYD